MEERRRLVDYVVVGARVQGRVEAAVRTWKLIQPVAVDHNVFLRDEKVRTPARAATEVTQPGDEVRRTRWIRGETGGHTF
jgi:hypothetical protein